MSILKVARMGHPVLRQRGRLIEKSDFRNPMVQKLIDDMIETMHEYNGVGLAAPQVHESLRVFVAMLDAGREARASGLINPALAPGAAGARAGRAAGAPPTCAAGCRDRPRSWSRRSTDRAGPSRSKPRTSRPG